MAELPLDEVGEAVKELMETWQAAAKKQYVFTFEERDGGVTYDLPGSVYEEIWNRAQGDALGICAVQLQPILAMIEEVKREDEVEG